MSSINGVNPELAQEIMGNNFFGIKEAMDHFGIEPTKDELQALDRVPFSEDVLKECEDTHVLVAVFFISILDIGEVIKLPFYSNYIDKYKDQGFAQNKGKVIWCLIKKTPVHDSVNKTWTEQCALLSSHDEVPSAQIIVYSIIGYYLKFKKQLFENAWVRTFCAPSNCCHVGVTNIGFYIDVDRIRASKLGLSSARKPLIVN
jgi:hypothetical protein